MPDSDTQAPQMTPEALQEMYDAALRDYQVARKILTFPHRSAEFPDALRKMRDICVAFRNELSLGLGLLDPEKLIEWNKAFDFAIEKTYEHAATLGIQLDPDPAAEATSNRLGTKRGQQENSPDGMQKQSAEAYQQALMGLPRHRLTGYTLLDSLRPIIPNTPDSMRDRTSTELSDNFFVRGSVDGLKDGYVISPGGGGRSQGITIIAKDDATRSILEKPSAAGQRIGLTLVKYYKPDRNGVLQPVIYAFAGQPAFTADGKVKTSIFDGKEKTHVAFSIGYDKKYFYPALLKYHNLRLNVETGHRQLELLGLDAPSTAKLMEVAHTEERFLKNMRNTNLRDINDQNIFGYQDEIPGSKNLQEIQAANAALDVKNLEIFRERTANKSFRELLKAELSQEIEIPGVGKTRSLAFNLWYDHDEQGLPASLRGANAATRRALTEAAAYDAVNHSTAHHAGIVGSRRSKETGEPVSLLEAVPPPYDEFEGGANQAFDKWAKGSADNVTLGNQQLAREGILFSPREPGDAIVPDMSGSVCSAYANEYTENALLRGISEMAAREGATVLNTASIDDGVNKSAGIELGDGRSTEDAIHERMAHIQQDLLPEAKEAVIKGVNMARTENKLPPIGGMPKQNAAGIAAILEVAVGSIITKTIDFFKELEAGYSFL